MIMIIIMIMEKQSKKNTLLNLQINFLIIYPVSPPCSTLCISSKSTMFQDFDPMAEHRIPKIADREDEYRARRRQMIISPERYDPFAQGNYNVSRTSVILSLFLL